MCFYGCKTVDGDLKKWQHNLVRGTSKQRFGQSRCEIDTLFFGYLIARDVFIRGNVRKGVGSALAELKVRTNPQCKLAIKIKGCKPKACIEDQMFNERKCSFG